jgi:uncharacterized protein YneF (UPF0154 family)
MGSMVVGVVVSAFLFTPFFVCQKHRHNRLGSETPANTAALRINMKPGPV